MKMAASIVAPSLTAIFTKSIITGVYPTEWKMARVTPVFKKGIKSNLNNYRPISVIPVVSKVFEKIVYDQLYQYLNDNQLLSSCQSGFRSLHSTLTALLEATNSWSVNIDNGFLNGVVFIDLKKAFDTIDHEIILRKLSYFGADQATAKWFQSYLSNRTLSITLSAKTVADLKLAVTSELNNLTCWLRANKLSLNMAKTELMIIGSRQRLNAQCEEIDISIDDRTIKRVDHTKSLGLTIDAQLSWSKHVDEISKKVSSAIGALKRVRPFIPTDVAAQIYNALILPHFDYCSPVWDGLSGCLSDKLQKLQNRAARVITQSPFDTSSNLLLTMLKWEKLSLRRKKQKALIMYKTLNELAPDYLQCLFTQRHVNDYNLRNLEGKLSLPKPNTNYLKRSFCYSGACLWNNLPQELKSVCSIGQFKRGIKKVSEISDSHTAIM